MKKTNKSIKIILRKFFLDFYSPIEKFNLIKKEQGELLNEIAKFHAKENNLEYNTSMMNLEGAIKFMLSTGNQKMTLPKDEDDAWHQFICFTKYYNDICKYYVGHFVNHNPCPESEAQSYFEYSISRMRFLFGSNGFNQNLRLTQGAATCSGCCN